jgi:hypothetical protein
MTMAVVCVARRAADAARLHSSDHLGLELNELDRKVGEPVSTAVCRAVLDDEILTFDISELFEPLSECVEVRDIRACVQDLQHADSMSRRLLRVENNRRGEEASRECADETPAMHATG